ncbi:MAG: hypothetical protein WBG37_14090 [Desulfobacterales bacterium]
MDKAKGHDKHGSGDHDMDHSEGAHIGHDTTFKHTMMEGGLHSEFQVMSLASMNMKDPEGNTHHIMVKMSREAEGEALKGVIGKIKVIAPSGAEQINSLKDYGGMLAANFTFEEKGKHGIICLVKVGEEKPVFKFWYPHK